MTILKIFMKSAGSFNPLFLIFLVFGFCSDSSREADNGSPDANSYKPVVAFPALTFTRPVDLQHAPDNSNRIFVVEQAGVISVFPNDKTVSGKTTFLDIAGKVDDEGNEEGLLGLAFHPDYKTNGYFYVNYTASGPERTVISRFKVSGNPNQADPASELVLLTFEQPYSNHNGGQVSFGPDGYLYIATGDGGSGGDPHDNGQNRATLLGKILRIDVNKQENGKQYGIPADNPFVNNTQGYRQEIYAYGLRNPWRFSFDAENGRLWTGDVGQNDYEEIDVIEKGGNYGWNTMEAAHCFEPKNGCDRSGLKLPVHEYGRGEGISVTGGFVYHGPTLTGLKGQYIYADYATRRVWAIEHSSLSKPVNTKLFEADFNISSFGIDQNNELYLCGFDGKIYQISKL
jgi:glucose/arabinose dehydrogenase